MANKNIQELKFQVGEAWKGVYSSSTAYGLANVVQDATGLSIYRSLKSGNVGHPLTDANWWFCIIDMSSIKAESDRIAALNQAIAQDEALRVAAEELRQQHEAARVEAEIQRNEAEQTRISAEQARVNAESARATAEQQRIAAEQGRVSAESARVQAEQARVLAETLRANAEDARAAAETNRAAAEQQRIANEQTRIAQEQQRETKEAERQQTFVQSQAARQQAYEQAEAARNTAFNEHEAERDAEAAALQTKLEEGDVIPALAGNLESWAEDVSEVSNSWDETVRSTAGDDPIDTAFGGVLTDIVAKTDFKCDALVTSGYNLLRLVSNGGVAVAVGDGWYFPVPHLELGAFGDATKNNGVLLTDKDGNNINNATVRFKALADGVPTSENDGVTASYQDVTYNDETFRTYLTGGAGYLIVSGITYADTCAHLAWEDWYDKYVSPTDEDDAGDSISLTALFTAAPNGTGKFLVLGSGGNMVATRATRTSSTQMTITDPIGRVTSPSWTNELQEDEETYKHSLTISGMKADGLAQIEGIDQVLLVEGTTVSYTDTNATAISGAVRYEKATAATANVALTKTQYALNDCGIEMKSGATGEAYFGCTYSQNVADALSQIAKVKLDISLSVVAEALLYLYSENKALRELLAGKDNAVLPVVKAQSVECDDILTLGVPNVLYSSVEGAPSAANVPDNWNEETMTVWNGCPRKIGQQYVDKASKKVYYAVAVTGSTSDWVALN
jgi:hypothetical protein